MAFSRARILDALARLPFVDNCELALILGEPPSPAHPTLAATFPPAAVSDRRFRPVEGRRAGSGFPGWDTQRPPLALRELEGYEWDALRRRTYRRETRYSC